MLTQDGARAIARKLKAEIKPGRRHDIVIFRHKGKHVAQFGISRSSREQGHHHIARQLYITQKQCRELEECPLSIDDYLKILESKQLLPSE